MRLSHYFLPVLKETPSEAQIISHQLMLRAGMVRQEAAGIYSWLPLGLRVMKKIEQIVHEEQERAGALEILMPTLQPADLWRESGRYDDYGREMLRIKDRHDRDLLYGPTNEEMMTAIFRASGRSYKDVPKILYHVQWKFRDEIRPRFGVMRGREFLMKDGYSFDLDEQTARHSYALMFVSYLKTFARMGLEVLPVKADTGPIGGDLSHEFILLAQTGESQVHCHKDIIGRKPEAGGEGVERFFEETTGLYAAADDVHDPVRFEQEVPPEKRFEGRGIEVGHIFYFGTKYSQPMKARVMGPDGEDRVLHMGSYGIGVSRLVGAVIEASHDEAGIIWPKALAPFKVGLINLKAGDARTDAVCEDAYQKLQAMGLDPLYDDRSERAGVKFSTMDLIGLPYQMIVGPRGAQQGMVELKNRATGERQDLSPEAAFQALSSAFEGEGS